MAKDNVETNEFGVAAPDGQLKRLAPLVGKWHTDFETKDSIYGPGARGTSDEEFYWLDGGYFLVQTYRTVFGSEPAQTGINYWYYDPDKKRFGIIFFSNNGNFTEDGSRLSFAKTNSICVTCQCNIQVTVTSNEHKLLIVFRPNFQ